MNQMALPTGFMLTPFIVQAPNLPDSRGSSLDGNCDRWKRGAWWGSAFNRHKAARLCDAPLSTSLARVNSSLFDETQGISPRVLRIERALAPRAHHDATCRCIVHVLA